MNKTRFRPGISSIGQDNMNKIPMLSGTYLMQ
jgi:hypothetical protein